MALTILMCVEFLEQGEEAMPKCEHGLTSKECYVCASPKHAEQAEKQEPESFEQWNAKQHGDPEEIGFLQALRIVYCAGQDSVAKATPQPQRELVGLADEEIEQKSSKKCSCFAYSASECICGAWDQQPIAHRFVDVECPLCGEMAVAHTHPVLNKREWVGLTQQDIDIAFDDTQEGGGFNEFAETIEQILRRKNT